MYNFTADTTGLIFPIKSGFIHGR